MTEEPDAPDVVAEPPEAEGQGGDQSEAPDSRCEAETTVGGTPYRCALQAEHDGEHAFQPAEEQPEAPATTAGEQARDQRKVSDALDAEAVRHAARVAEILGAKIPGPKEPDRLGAIVGALASEGLTTCELCSPRLAGWRGAAAPDDETTKRVRVAIGLPDVSNFAASATERQCDDCRGLGKVRTGSSVPKYETATCDACSGRGWVQSRPRLHEDAPPPVDAPEQNGPPPPPDDGIRRDMFGTPEGDPDFEKLPGARVRPIEYWQTHHT